MKKVLALFALAAALLFPGQIRAQAINYEVYIDTLWDDSTTDSLMWLDTMFQLSLYEDISLRVKCRDTSEAGFGNDSLEAIVLYQLGKPSQDTSGARDTGWSELPTILDTVTSDSLGKCGRYNTVAENGALTAQKPCFDTLTVAGYAIYDMWFVPEWAPFIRFGLLIQSNNSRTPNEWVFEVGRRQASMVRQ